MNGPGAAPSTAAPPSRPATWRIRGGSLALDRPLVMGILNVTPDSFSDGGRYLEAEDAVRRAHRMVEEGADLVDVGGESTRPGAPPVSADEEWARVGPVLEALDPFPVPVSVDTTKTAVAARALEAGAAVVNDVSGLRFEPELAELAARYGAGLVVMHMRGDPRTMQEDVTYDDLMGEVTRFLAGAVERARERGVDEERIVVDPGIGFGKSVVGNLELLARIGELGRLGRPVLVGPSRKSFIGGVLDLPVEERVEATQAACVLALAGGARVFRVHDVRAARRSLDLAAAVLSAAPGAGSVGHAAPPGAPAAGRTSPGGIGGGVEGEEGKGS